MKIKEAATLGKIVLKQKFPLMLEGAHGIGKSQLIYQFGEELGLPVLERRLSQMVETDMIGLGHVKTENGMEVTSWTMIDWIARACAEPCILFLDEVDRGSAQIIQMVMQITDSRSYLGYELHPDTLICSAINGSSGDYDNTTLEPAVLDRWVVFKIEFDHGHWMEWLRNKYRDSGKAMRIVSYLEKNENFATYNGIYKAEKTPSPRSWDRFTETYRDNDMETYMAQSICSGFVGFEASLSLGDFLRKTTILSIGAILEGKKFGQVAIDEQASLVNELKDLISNGNPNQKDLRTVGKWLALHALDEIVESWSRGISELIKLGKEQKTSVETVTEELFDRMTALYDEE